MPRSRESERNYEAAGGKTLGGEAYVHCLDVGDGFRGAPPCQNLSNCRCQICADYNLAIVIKYSYKKHTQRINVYWDI